MYYTYVYVCMYLCMYVCMYVCLYVRMYVCIYIYIYKRTYVHTNIHTYIHTYIDTYTHTHKYSTCSTILAQTTKRGSLPCNVNTSNRDCANTKSVTRYTSFRLYMYSQTCTTY